ncbi:MAG TPA: hypothetical protein VLT90_13060 [Terriglobales bacterium]|nr:hypothetical protein [Terriglobales bacterium]
MNATVLIHPSATTVTVLGMAKLLAVNPETIRRYIRKGLVSHQTYTRLPNGRYAIYPRAFVNELPGVQATIAVR